MTQRLKYVIFSLIILASGLAWGQDTVVSKLHLKIYDEGVCYPMVRSNNYSETYRPYPLTVLQSAGYYSTIFATVRATGASDLNPQHDHKTLSSSLQFNNKLDYVLVIFRSKGFDRTTPDSMVIKISELDCDAQLVLPFKTGKYNLQKMKFFTPIKKNEAPNFLSTESYGIKNELKLDSTAYFANGKSKALYYEVAASFNLFFVQEFDSIDPMSYAQGFRLMSNYHYPAHDKKLPIAVYGNKETNKYGYWEYFENGVCIQHEMWTGWLNGQYVWYPSRKIKWENHFDYYSQKPNKVYYLENGAIKENFYLDETSRVPLLKIYAYSDDGHVAIVKTFKSANGITKQELVKRELFYPSGQLKMEENFTGNYTVKYFNENGTERIK